ncbi:MAG: aminoacyl-tRNA hydrolase [Chitinophagales bacterium]|nr:aminoacyl-tRNA hydrolase [Chitinophagales bacterium]
MKYLIAGLGNFGIDYHDTRHNVGFDVVDFLAQEKGVSFASKRYADMTTFKLKGKTFILIKPTTYMNLSGKAIKYWLDKENIPYENLLVVTDDLNLPLGKMRIKKSGSAGGHNGLKSVEEILNSNQYPRLRVGIGDGFSKGKQVDFVLGSWNAEEKIVVAEVVKKAADATISFALEGIERAMNKFN